MNRPVAYCLVTLLMPMHSIMVDKTLWHIFYMWICPVL